MAVVCCQPSAVSCSSSATDNGPRTTNGSLLLGRRRIRSREPAVEVAVLRGHVGADNVGGALVAVAANLALRAWKLGTTARGGLGIPLGRRRAAVLGQLAVVGVDVLEELFPAFRSP